MAKYGRKPTEAAVDEDTQSAVADLIAQSAKFVDDTLSPQRERASRYYNADPFGNEEPGRSQLVLSEVRDGIQGVLPSLLRVLFGPERIVEYVPTDPRMVEQAREATDAVHSIFLEQNNGFMTSHSVIKDGLLKKMGVYQWGAEEERIVGPEYDVEVSMGEVPVILDNEEIELVAEAPMPEAEGMVRLTLRKNTVRTRHKVWAVPPEEFLFDRNARSIEEAQLVGRRRELTTSDLLLMGVDQADIDAHGGTTIELSDNVEAVARREAQTREDNRPEEPIGKANELNLYVEAWVHLDTGDGTTALKKVCTLGAGYHVVSVKDAEDRPFALFCPDPEAHTLLGQSWADRLMDMQLYKSSLLRGASDSLALSIFPRMGFVEGRVNLQDVLNTEIGAPIRMKDQNAVQVIAHPFIGKEALTLAAYADDIIERRTGRNKGTAGLDSNSLQSSTREGVQAVLSQSQEQQELLARIFAEGTMKPMFRGLLKMLVRSPAKGMLAKVGGTWTAIDPARWDAEMGVAVNVALGTNALDSRVNDLMMIASKQEQMLSSLGPSNPLVTLPQYRHTLARLLQARSIRDVDAYFTPLPPDWQPPPPPPPPPTPEQTLAQAQLEVEKMRTQRELEIKGAELSLKEADMALRQSESQQKMALERERMLMEADVRLEVARMAEETKRLIAGNKDKVTVHGQLSDAASEEERLDVERERIAAEREAAAAQRAAQAAGGTE
jgi:hypothetical protein